MTYVELFLAVGIYVVLGFLFLKYRNEKSGKKKTKIYRFGLFFFFFLNTLSLLVFLVAGGSRIQNGEIERNKKGGGSREEELLVSVEGVCEEIPVSVKVSEKGYSQSEMEEILREEAQKLEKKILGENRTRSRISKDLILPAKIPGMPITIQWEQDRYQYMDMTGKLKGKIPENGEKIHLQAQLLFWQGGKIAAQTEWDTDVVLYPPDFHDQQDILKEVERQIKENDTDGQTKDTLTLPKEINGKKIEWKKRVHINGYQILGLGTVGFILFLWGKKQKEEERKKTRKEQMIHDYPEILEQFCLLIGAGMTVRSTWEKIVMSYQKRKGETGARPAYEEMEKTCYEMQGGVSEREGYENFGKRCQIQEYMRLGLLLSQNLKKGTRGLSELLSLEAVHAFEERKARAKRKGEEAGTKLLMPMIMMLGIVLIIVIVPAFWSIGI